MKKLLLLTIIFFVGCHNVDNVDVPFENLDSDEVFSYDTDPQAPYTYDEIRDLFCDAVDECGGECIPNGILAPDCDTESHDFEMCQLTAEGIYCDGSVYIPANCIMACKR